MHWRQRRAKTHTHRSFQRITRALFVFTLNAAVANLYSLYSICRLKPAQKSSDPRPWIWHGTQFRNSIRTASDGPSKWKRLCKMMMLRLQKVKLCETYIASSYQGSALELGACWNTQYHIIRLSFLKKHMLGSYAPHRVGIKPGRTGPPMKAFRMRRSGLGPRRKKSTGVVRRNVWIFGAAYFPKKCL